MKSGVDENGSDRGNDWVDGLSMKREGLAERGTRIALTLGMLLMVSVSGMRGIGYGSVTGENAGDAGHSLAAGGNEENVGLGSRAEKSTGMTDMSEMAGAVLSTDDLGKKTAPARLAQDEPELEMQGDVLTYGGLAVTIPDGIEAKRLDAQDSGNIFDLGHFLSDGSKGRILDLCGAQDEYADRVGGDGIEVYLALPPRVRLMHYRAVYESETALLCAFFDLLPEAAGRRMYADEEKREYAYRLEQDGYLYLFLVRGEEVCLVQETVEEEDCSFGQLFSDGMARWREDGGTVGFWKKPDAFTYRKIVPEEGISLFYASEREADGARLRLYREGYYGKPCQEIGGYIKAERDIRVGDMNFDGCPDLTGYADIFLWNRKMKGYERAQADIPFYYLYHRQFPETASFWGNSTYQASKNEDSVRQAEAIWQWEGNTLVKKRECAVSDVEEGVRVRAYEDTGRVLFDETFSTEEWEQEEQGRVLWLYRQFYDGMVPEAVYGVEHRLEGGQKHIPQGFLDEIGGMMAAGEDSVVLSKLWDGKGVSHLKGMAVGRALTEEETVSLAEKDMAVRQQVQRAARYSYRYTVLEADCDNDGRKDLVWALDGPFIGGTSGNVEYVYLQGQQDGSYAETDSFFETRETFYAVSYEGKNYLLYEGIEPLTMVYNGYIVRSYADGKLAEEARVYEVFDRYEKPWVWAATGYEELTAVMAEKCDALKGQFDEGEMIEGGAEQRTGRESEQPSAYEMVSYRCDLDNDGKEEKYSKWVRELNFFDGGVHLEFDVTEEGAAEEDALEGIEGVDAQDSGGNSGLAILTEELESSTDTPVALWAEEYGGKNIVYELCLTGLYDYKITGWLVEESDCNRVCEIAVDAAYRVRQDRKTVF